MTASLRGRRIRSGIVVALTALCALVSISTLFLILGYVTWQGASSLSWGFLTRLPRPVGEEGGGIANAIVGSLKIVGLASAIGIPAGILGGTYLAEFGNRRLAFLIRTSADVLNSTPSIVVGIFAYSILVLPMRRFSALSGSVALAIIMFPIVLRNSEEFIRLVPMGIREAGLSLGVPRWKVILRIVLPTAGQGLLTSAILAVARISGETAPLLFTAFGNHFWDNGWLHPMATLPLAIFTYAISPYDEWHRQAWAAALILVGVVLTGSILARFVLRQRAS